MYKYVLGFVVFELDNERACLETKLTLLPLVCVQIKAKWGIMTEDVFI